MRTPLILTAAALGLLALAGPTAAPKAAEPYDEEPGEAPAPKPVQIPPRAELDKLVAALGSKGESLLGVQDRLTEYLKADRGNTVLEAVGKGLASGPPLQRVLSLYCLRDSGRPDAVAIIARHLADPDPFVRRAAVMAVSSSKTATPEQAATLREYLHSKDEVVRKEAVLAAGRLKDTEALPMLIEMLETDNLGLRDELVWALREITGRDFGADQAAWTDWYEFYEQEVATAHDRGGDASGGGGTGSTSGGSRGREARPIPRSGGGGDAYTRRVGDEAQAGARLPWGAILSGLAAVVLIGGWIGARLWLGATMKGVLKADASTRSASMIASRFAFSDLLPGFIVYPFLSGCIARGSQGRVSAALHVLMFRVHGGCRRVASRAGRLPQQKPVPGGRELVLRLPRGLLTDMALVGNPAGRCLIRIAEPDNPSWKGEPSEREVQLARKHLAERPQSDN